MRVIIIEDNEIDMENLRILLEGVPEYMLIGTANDIHQGIQLAKQEKPDLILLDIQVGSENSLEHIGALDYDPVIICTTLYDDHALEAFDVGAMDYLTKPITPEKLDRVIQRIEKRVAAGRPESSSSIALKIGTTTHVVEFTDIILITGERDYTMVLDVKQTSYLCAQRMLDWKECLSEDDFIQLDRSTIVNFRQIESFHQDGSLGRANVLFKNGHFLEVGRTACKRLKAVFE